ncbi:hypothetical protein [Nitrosopumilus ureiphilus]|uniref:Uncharacterized protein n=1 Tax=Nitrosopumilus ureiphilus TaxID=1470067 RepID=A0A7D5M4Y8_9ARCH|nr:hypothetical protein [Nitrosopumilus ureiphilus]QLH06673.1 hypothetical protein C5F50_05975 [Nitrosopumilus ureiphilus]
MPDELDKIGKLIKYAVYYDKRNPRILIHQIGVHKLFKGERVFDSPVDAWTFFSNKDDTMLFTKSIHDANPQLPIKQCMLCKI